MPLTPKCVQYFERRPYPPGQHGRARPKTQRLQDPAAGEAAAARAVRHQRDAAARRSTGPASGGKTGEELIIDLETRLDALVLRAGFARTIYQARQVVTHQHLTVNGRRVDRPSARLRPGDVIEVAERSRQKAPFVIAAAGAHVGERTAPTWSVDVSGLTARLIRLPLRREVPVICDEQLIVEFYSR